MLAHRVLDEALLRLESEDFDTRLYAVSLVAELRDPCAAAPLATLLRRLRCETADDAVFATAVIRALGLLGDAAVVPEVVPFLMRGPLGDLEVEETACAALVLLGGAEAVAALRQKFLQPGCAIADEVAEALLTLEGGEVADFFLAQLVAGDGPRRAVAAWALGLLGDHRALPALTHAAEHAPWPLCARAGEALAAMRRSRIATGT